MLSSCLYSASLDVIVRLFILIGPLIIMLWLFLILLGGVFFVIWLILALLGLSRRNPTVTGVIISLLFGVLPLYLVLCFFGLMGDEKIR